MEEFSGSRDFSMQSVEKDSGLPQELSLACFLPMKTHLGKDCADTCRRKEYDCDENFTQSFVFPECDAEVPDQKALLNYARTFRDGVAQGFSLLESAPAVSVYQKGPDYVIAADLSAGASLDVLEGKPVNSENKSVYGGPNPDYGRMSAEQAYEKGKQQNAEAVAVVNAEFFANLPKSSVPVAFPFRKDGIVESEGFAGVDKHAGNRLTLAMNDKYARIIPFDNNNISEFRNIKEEDAVVSLSPRVNIDGSSGAQIGRTFVGLGNPDADGNYTRVLIFVSSASSQAHAELTLRQFGAGPTIMFDGGGSSQLLWKERNLVDSIRTVPNYLSIRAARK